MATLVSLIIVCVLPPQVLADPWQTHGRHMASTWQAHVEPVHNDAVAGKASWYDYHEGQAAAGPELRTTLGPHWRGMVVRTCTTLDCVEVRLTDWCQCYRHTDHERLIDLDVRDFAKLGSPSRGVLTVSVSPP